MTSRSARLGALAAAISVAVLGAQRSGTPAFRAERPIVVDGAGPRRLAIDVALLAGAAPFRVVSRTTDPESGTRTAVVANGLGDLRIYDSGGREVGYLLVRNPPGPPRFRTAAILPVAPVDTDRLKTSGFEADLGEPALVDGLRMDGLPPPYLKRVRLEGSGDRERWTLLVDEGTIFELPDEQLRLTELRFTPGSFRYLRMTFDDTNSARLPRPPSAAAREVAPGAPPPPLRAAVTFERRAAEPGRSRFRIHLPGAHLPIVGLDLDVGGNYVLRRTRVFEARLSGAELVPASLGEATLRRVVRGNVAAAALRLPIEPPSEPQLELEVDDEDNPPLDLRGVSAVFAELPWIYLDSPGGALTARYGNDGLTAPRYDIEAARSQIRIETIAEAKWGEPRARSAADNAAAGPAPPLPTRGAPLDTSLFKYVRDVPSGNSGLIAVPLDVAVLAHSVSPTSGFPDLRAIDASGSQIPYVLERVSEPLTLDVSPERIATPPGTLPPSQSARSVYRITYPFVDLPATRLSLSTPARVFDRGVVIAVERPPTERRRDAWLETVTTARWVHADQERAAMPLTLSLPALHATDVLIVVDEGDNSPLPLGPAHILLPSSRIRLFRDQTTAIRLAYGRTDLNRPQYDLALLAPQVLGTAAEEVAAGPERQNAAAASTAALVSPRLFWAALILSVVVLLFLIGRLLRSAV